MLSVAVTPYLLFFLITESISGGVYVCSSPNNLDREMLLQLTSGTWNCSL